MTAFSRAPRSPEPWLRPALANAMTEAELVATRDMLDYRIGVLAIMAEPRVEGDWSKLELDKHRALRSRVLAALRWFAQQHPELEPAEPCGRCDGRTHVWDQALMRDVPCPACQRPGVQSEAAEA